MLGGLLPELRRRPGGAIMNIFGLATGIAVFLTMAMFVRFETSFDAWFASAEEVYLVQDVWTVPGQPEERSLNTMGGLLDRLRADYRGLNGTRVWPADVSVRLGAEAVAQPAVLADSSFFQVFDWPVLQGSLSSALVRPGSVVVTQSAARRLFRTADAVGRTLSLSVDGVPGSYRVTAVIGDVPDNSMFEPGGSGRLPVELILPLPATLADDPSWSDWGAERLKTFVRFPDAESAARFEAGLPAFLDRNAPPSESGRRMSNVLHHKLVPLRDIHLLDEADRAIVAIAGLVGILTLMIAIINYVNLATARATLRAREVAIRKVVGASRRQLITRFIGEALATAALSAALGLALVELSLPFINGFVGTRLDLVYFGPGGMLPLIVALILLVGIGAGAYPAFVLSGFKPAAVLSSSRVPSGGRMGSFVRELLVTGQFCVSIALAVGTAVLWAQNNHLRAADLGFQRDDLILVTSFRDPALDDARRQSLLASFRTVPGVSELTLSDAAPGDESTNVMTSIDRPDGVKPSPLMMQVTVAPRFFETYGARLLAGRLFSESGGIDSAGADAELRGAVLNVSGARALGFRDPQAAVGKTVRGGQSFTIVGVVQDLRFRSPREPVRPAMFLLSLQPMSQPIATVRAAGAVQPALAELRRRWQRIAADVPFSATTAASNLADAYWTLDAQRTRMFGLGALLALAISSVGLFGLASFAAERRTREMGLRKALGASTPALARLLLAQFLRPVGIAVLIAWPLAYFATQSWLSGFNERIDVGPAYFVSATLAAVALAGATVIAQVVRLARTRPAEALRYE
jgi:putative ABC transport system permease protein